jgi:hypothetical protein
MLTPGGGIRLTKNPKTGKWEEATDRSFKGVRYVSIPWRWLELCSRLPGKTLSVAALIWLQRDLKQTPTITLPSAALARCGVDRRTMYRGLLRLEALGLIAVSRRPGAKPIITIVDQEGTRLLDAKYWPRR